MRYRNVNRSAIDLADGSIVGSGAFKDLSAKDAAEPHNAAHISDGVLIEAPKSKPIKSADAEKESGK